MKKINIREIFACVIATAALVCTFFTFGCESESVGDSVISINPSGAKLALGGAVSLTASGGWNYKWSLSNNSIGRLSATTGNTVIYTATATGENQTVTVTGMGGTGTGSNKIDTASTYSAEAIIQQGETSALNVSGDTSITVGGDPIILSASGGDEVNYTWKLGNSSIGTLSSLKGNAVSYTAKSGAGASQQITIVSGSLSTSHVVLHKIGGVLSWVGTSSQTIGQSGSANNSCTLRVENNSGTPKWYVIGDSTAVTVSSSSGTSTVVTGGNKQETVTIMVSDDNKAISCTITVR